MAGQRHIAHPFEPVFDERSRVLMLGTMPSPRSRADGFYYGHPQNRFWNVLATLFDEPVALTNDRKRDFLLRHHIAVWDVLASCDIEGASDASISQPKPNNLSRILTAAPIEAVFCTGAKAAELYAKLCEPETGMPAAKLPSTSPANAACKLDDLIEAYRPLLAHLHPFEAPTLDVTAVVELEQRIASSGTSLAELMDRAGRALSHRVHVMNPASRVAVLCGSGNNGGDGWVAAADLCERGHNVTLLTSKEPDKIKADPAAGAARKAANALSASPLATVLVDPCGDKALHALARADIIVDAILGTGFDGGDVKQPYATWIREAGRRRASGALVVAADTPSGLSAQTGKAASPCVTADATITMLTAKPGLSSEEGRRRCGTLHVAALSYIEPFFGC